MTTVGDRIRLRQTSDPFTYLRPGALGTVTAVGTDGCGGEAVAVAWDAGQNHRLSLLQSIGDRWNVLTEPQRAPERNEPLT